MPIRNKYREYFTIDERYFPCIDESAIRAGAPWENTYPHETFVKMLEAMKDALDRRNDGKSLWIEGPFGSGKSQCAHALRRILEAPEAELRAYWGAFEPLRKRAGLLDRLMHHKKCGIAVAYRYASGSIASPRELFFAVQESVREALERAGAAYLGENTIREAMAEWLEIPRNNNYFNELLKEREWASLFPQADAGEVARALRGGGEARDLVSKMFRLSAKEGITAFSLDAERLKSWLRDVIEKNNTKIVLIWDEFSDYFERNKESLSEFQNIASLVQEKPFYFNIVTHQTSHTIWQYMDRLTLQKLKNRFETVQIDLPPNIAFELIGHAFGATEAAKPTWERLAGDLNSRLTHSRDKVMKATGIENPQVIKDIMPLHPVAALLLKHVAVTFDLLANQRSMFNFIKSSSAGGAKAFQWFIDTTGPHDDHPLLTVDLLWDFVYEKGKGDLPPDVRAILDAFGQHKGLREDEEAVLKTVLLMQAMDHKLAGAEDLFKATDQNLSYAFEGVTGLDGSRAGNLAKGLVDRSILIRNPIAEGRFAYALAVYSGDQAKIDEHKKNVEKQASTAKLATEGGLATALALPPALRLRFEAEPGTGKITAVTLDDFTKITNALKDKKDDDSKWRFHAVMAFAQNDAEAAELRRKIKERAADEAFSHIVFIDALSTPLGQEALERYLNYSAMAAYYQGSNNATSRDNADNARHVLDQEWRDRISRGPLVVYTHGDQEGAKYGGAEGVGGPGGALEAIVLAKFPRAFDFARGLSENQLKASQMKASAQYGIGQGLKEDGGKATGPIAGAERHVLPTVWRMDRYWDNPSTKPLPISEMKRKLDESIDAAFKESGQASIQDAYDFLEASYGLAPCNLSSFLAGFLLKEYGGEPYRYGDSDGHQEPMSQDKLAEMLGNYIGRSPKPKPTFIVKMNQEEKAFCDFTERAWGIPANLCTSAAQATGAVAEAMRRLGLPVWCLRGQAGGEAFGVIEAYIDLVRGGAEEAQGRALAIGRMADKAAKASSAKLGLAGELRGLLTHEGVQKGMLEYLESPEGGGVMALAREIGAQDAVLGDARALFDVKHACLWDRRTGEEEIRRLLTDYGIVKESNAILNVRAGSLQASLDAWREKLKFYNVPCDALKARYPALSRALGALLRVFRGDAPLPDHLRELRAELLTFGPEIKDVLDGERDIFAAEFEPYLEGLGGDEIGELRSKLQIGGLFGSPKTECNAKVKDAADEYRKNQKKTRLAALWREKTGTKNPWEWSSRHKTPILCCVPAAEYDRARRAFDALNKHGGTDAEIDDALDFLEKSDIFGDLGDAKRDAAFMRDVVGEFRSVLRDPEKVRDALDGLSIETGAYGWRESPKAKEKVRRLAEAEYGAGGSARVISVIDGMDDAKLKQYLKDLAKKSIELGMAILADAEGGR